MKLRHVTLWYHTITHRRGWVGLLQQRKALERSYCTSLTSSAYIDEPCPDISRVSISLKDNSLITDLLRRLPIAQTIYIMDTKTSTKGQDLDEVFRLVDRSNFPKADGVEKARPWEELDLGEHQIAAPYRWNIRAAGKSCDPIFVEVSQFHASSNAQLW